MEHFQAEEGSRLLPSISIMGQRLNDSTCKCFQLTTEKGKKKKKRLCLFSRVKEQELSANLQQSWAFLQYVLFLKVYFCPKNGSYLLAERNFYGENHDRNTRLSSPA